jgi:predicted dehydrogenase
VRWLVDIDTDRAASVAQSVRGDPLTSADYGDALSDTSVEAISICLPHALHAPVAIEAAQAGNHVLCEKPMAASLDQADGMIEAAERAGITLMVAENVRFDPLLRRIRTLLDGGVIGRPALIQVRREAYLTQSLVRDRRWFLDAELAAGGIMMSGGVHDVEVVRMLVGEVDRVFAFQARQRFGEMEGDDTSTALLHLENGAVGVLVESFVMKSLTTAGGAEVHAVRIDGDLGSVAVDDGEIIQLYSERPDLAVDGPTVEHRIRVPPGDTFHAEIQHFLAVIQAGEEPITSGRSQRRPLEVVLAAYRSMETGLPVDVSIPELLTAG